MGQPRRNCIFKGYQLHSFAKYICCILYRIKEISVSSKKCQGFDRRHVSIFYHFNGNCNIYFGLHLLLNFHLTVLAIEVLKFILSYIEDDPHFCHLLVQLFIARYTIIVFGTYKYYSIKLVANKYLEWLEEWFYIAHSVKTVLSFTRSVLLLDTNLHVSTIQNQDTFGISDIFYFTHLFFFIELIL